MQLLKEISNNVSKIPSSELYFLKKYYKENPLEEYLSVRFQEEFSDKSAVPGIKDSELVELLLSRVETKYKWNRNNQELTQLLMRVLDCFIETENNG